MFEFDLWLKKKKKSKSPECMWQTKMSDANANVRFLQFEKKNELFLENNFKTITQQQQQ